MQKYNTGLVLAAKAAGLWTVPTNTGMVLLAKGALVYGLCLA